uniref:Uncharacterized protein n=1 Tax=Heterorhabditis bacteriophora TaxID=37862 RepID=A0A1I7XLY8_HETBA
MKSFLPRLQLYRRVLQSDNMNILGVCSLRFKTSQVGFLKNISLVFMVFIFNDSRDYVSESLRSEDFFNLDSLVTVSDMFNARLHYGHKEY